MPTAAPIANWHANQLTPAFRKRGIQCGHQAIGIRNAPVHRAMGDRVLYKIWVIERHAVIGKTIHSLFPTDHPVFKRQKSTDVIDVLSDLI
jgi:hypothetical protein